MIFNIRLNRLDRVTEVLHSMVARMCLFRPERVVGLCTLDIRSCTGLTSGDDNIITKSMLDRMVATKLV